MKSVFIAFLILILGFFVAPYEVHSATPASPVLVITRDASAPSGGIARPGGEVFVGAFNVSVLGDHSAVLSDFTLHVQGDVEYISSITVAYTDEDGYKVQSTGLLAGDAISFNGENMIVPAHTSGAVFEIYVTTHDIPLGESAASRIDWTEDGVEFVDTFNGVLYAEESVVTPHVSGVWFLWGSASMFVE